MTREGSPSGLAAPLSREVRLVAACCRWPPSKERSEQVRLLAGEGIDWSLLLAVARRQRVMGLVRDALAQAKLATPPQTRAALEQASRTIAARNLKVLSESVRLGALFRARSIPVMFLKGLPLARLAYGSISAKHSRDIDLLVPEERALEAWSLLEAEGYGLASIRHELGPAQRRAMVRYSADIELVRRADGLPLDLHWRPTQNPVLFDAGGIWGRIREVELQGGQQLPTLGDADLFAYLCAHGGLHVWARMKWLADLNALVAGRPADELEALYRHAKAMGSGLCAGQGLLLCRRLFQLDLPVGLERELSADRRIGRLVQIALKIMIGPDGATERAALSSFGAARYLTYLSLLLLGDSWAYYLAQLKMLSIGGDDITALALPEPLHFLYPMVRAPLWTGRMIRKALQPSARGAG
jgi:hypothetical protein